MAHLSMGRKLFFVLAVALLAAAIRYLRDESPLYVEL